MTREAYDAFLSAIEQAGIKSYSMAVMGGNVTIVHEDPDEVEKPVGFIIDKGDYLISLQRSRDYMSKGKFDVYYYPLDMCDAVAARGLSFKGLTEMISNEMNDSIKAWIKQVPVKRLLNPEATTTIGEDNTLEAPMAGQYVKQETVKSGEPYETPYHTIKDIENLPKTEDEVSTIPPREESEETENP